MFTKRTGHIWHMLLMVSIVAAAFWLGAGAGGALLLAMLACTAMIVAVVWIAARPIRLDDVEPLPIEPRAPHPSGWRAPTPPATRDGHQLDRDGKHVVDARSPRRSR